MANATILKFGVSGERARHHNNPLRQAEKPNQANSEQATEIDGEIEDENQGNEPEVQAEDEGSIGQQATESSDKPGPSGSIEEHTPCQHAKSSPNHPKKNLKKDKITSGFVTTLATSARLDQCKRE
ncbi:hypothetical protein BSL78_04235 [Apostichopus japonicus]|uniref:Uncharacterized protein n=1 Tax=Stichopus japonicus TaxID=307972 RepID=A0A2G8LF13_STIJA|nr:hypothetical protein BSL78_04235 [Apostichopus japonicus]